MTRTKMDYIWSKNLLDESIRTAVSKALRDAHGNTSSARKNIARLMRLNKRTVKNWYEGRNPPDAAHLLVLMHYYPSILQAVLRLIDLEALWQIAVREDIPIWMAKEWAKTYLESPKRGDILYENGSENSAFFLNERQIWFLDMLQKTDKMQNKHIASRWNVDPRTAKRDTKQLVVAGLIHSVRSGSTGWFEWTGEPYAQ